MSPLKSSKLMWPQSSELKSTNLTRARCPMKAATSQNVRVIPSVQNLDEAFLTTCKPKANVYSIEEKTYFAVFLVGLERDYTSGEKKGMYLRKPRVQFWITRDTVGTLVTGACFQDYFYCIHKRRIAKFDWIPGALWSLRLNSQVLPRFTVILPAFRWRKLLSPHPPPLLPVDGATLVSRCIP